MYEADGIIHLGDAFDQFLTPAARKLHNTTFEESLVLQLCTDCGIIHNDNRFHNAPKKDASDEEKSQWAEEHERHRLTTRVTTKMMEFLPCPTDDLSFQCMLSDDRKGVPFSERSYIKATMKRLAEVYNRCVDAGWLKYATWMRCTAIPVGCAGLHRRYEIMVVSASEYFHLELNAKLGASLFVLEGQDSSRGAWRTYEILKDHRRRFPGGL